MSKPYLRDKQAIHNRRINKQALTKRLMKTNGNTPEIPDFIPVLIFRRVDCAACKQGAAMGETDLVVCRSVEELTKRAIDEHKAIKEKTGVICTGDKYNLIIYYDNVFISAKYLMDAADESVITKGE